MQVEDTNEVRNVPQATPRVKSRRFTFRRGVFLLLRIILFLIFLSVLTITLIQWAPAQKRIVRYASQYFSKELQSTVKIDALELSLLGILNIKGIYLSEQNAPTDTLAAVQQISVRINPTYLLWGVVQINQLVISDATVKLKRNADAEKFNFDFIVAYFSDKSKKNDNNKTKKPLPDIRLSKLRMRHINFSLDDKYDGKFQQFSWDDALITTNFVDLPKRLIDIANINFKQLYVKIQELPPSAVALNHNISIAPNPQVLINVSNVSNTITDTSSKEKPFRLSLGALTVESSIFILDKYDGSPLRQITPHNIDFDHMVVTNIDIFAHNIFYSNWDWEGVIDGMSCKEKSGFEILKFTVGDIKVTPQITDLYGVRLETPYSVIGDSFRMTYSNYTDFKNFNNAVFMDVHINKAQIRLDDIMAFAPDLERNDFFIKNRNELATLSGNIKGKVNNLKVTPFKIEMKQNFNAGGIFEARDLTNKNETFIHLNLTDLKTDILTVRSIVPNFDLAPSYNKLGNVDFAGEFVGFYTDFTAKGILNTDLGTAKMDMKLIPGKALNAQTSYSGSIELIDFALGKFTDNTDLGALNIKATITKGVGFSRDNLNLDINSKISSLIYKNYTYTDINTDGNFNKKKFVGKVQSNDPNAAFSFDGSADISALKPIFDFKTQVFKIDLKKLGFLKDDIIISGTTDLNYSGGRLSEILGKAQFKNIHALKNGKENFVIDSLLLKVRDNDDKTKDWIIESDIGNAAISGKYNLEDLPDIVLTHFKQFHPRLASDLKLVPKYVNITPTVFNFNINIKDTKNWTGLFDTQLGAIQDLNLEGNFNNVADTLSLKIDSKNDISYKDICINALSTKVNADKSFLNWDLHTQSVTVGDNVFGAITLQNLVQGDSVEFGFTSKNLAPRWSLNKVELNASLFKNDSSYSLSFGTSQFSELNFFDNPWKIEKSNKIEFFRDSFAINNFDINHDSAHIFLKSTGRKGLSASLSNLDVSFVDSFVRDPRFTMRGKYKLDVAFSNILSFKDYTASLHLDSFFLKNEYRGATTINISGTDFEAPLTFDAQILRGKESLDAQGKYYFTRRDTFASQSIDVTGNFNNFGFDALHYIIDNGVSDFRGGISGQLRVNGPLKKISTNGLLHLRNGHVVIDYLKLPISVKDAAISITNTKINFSGDTIYDKFGNYGLVSGGLTHKSFRDFGLDAFISAPNFLFLDTKREDNALYYGTGMGAGDVTFTGDFNKVNIQINASAGKGTSIVFPFASDQTVKEASFVVFKSKVATATDSTDFKKQVKDVSGINLDMNINIRPEAELTLIFNESSGDRLHGSGTGDIHFALNRAGNISMDGEVRVEKGDYSFSLLNVVQKNFNLKPGGTIRWSGSPFDAILNIEAEYKNLNTSPYNLIAEYVESETNSKTESLKPTPINLSLRLSNALLHPDINFDIDFPNVSGNLKSYIENKLSLLRTDQNELNKQVFGLVVVGSFLPANVQNWNSTQLQSSGINTFSQSITSFISDKLTKVLSEYITGLDVEIGYNYYQFDKTDVSNSKSVTGSQWRLRGNYALSDRASLRGGLGLESGDFGNSSSGNSTFLGGDFSFEYALNADRRLRLRVSYILDQAYEGTRNKTGVGLLWRREFDNISELFEFIKKKKPKSEPLIPISGAQN